MAFAARKHDDGTWRLCLRMGETFLTVSNDRFPGVEIKFPSQAKTKACADALNKDYWKPFEKGRKANWPEPFEFYWDMLHVIAEHDGLTTKDMKELGL